MQKESRSNHGGRVQWTHWCRLKLSKSTAYRCWKRRSKSRTILCGWLSSKISAGSSAPYRWPCWRIEFSPRLVTVVTPDDWVDCTTVAVCTVPVWMLQLTSWTDLVWCARRLRHDRQHELEVLGLARSCARRECSRGTPQGEDIHWRKAKGDSSAQNCWVWCSFAKVVVSRLPRTTLLPTVVQGHDD